MSQHQRIEQEWQEFQERVIPNDAREAQRSEMKRAFFGGASALLCLINDVGAAEDTELEVIDALSDVTLELAEFSRDLVEKGHYPEPTCIYCGCTDSKACVDDEGGRCRWADLNRETNAGVCTFCAAKQLQTSAKAT